MIRDPRPALLARMKRLGLTYADIAARTGIPRQHVHRHLHQAPTITERNLAAIAAAIAQGKAPRKPKA